MSSQGLAKESCEENEGTSRAQGALASKGWQTAKKRQRQQHWDSDSTLLPGVQAMAAPWWTPGRQHFRRPSDTSSWMQPCSTTTRWDKNLLGAGAPFWSLNLAPKAHSPKLTVPGGLNRDVESFLQLKRRIKNKYKNHSSRTSRTGLFKNTKVRTLSFSLQIVLLLPPPFFFLITSSVKLYLFLP